MLVFAAVFSATESVTRPEVLKLGALIDVCHIDRDIDAICVIGRISIVSRNRHRVRRFCLAIESCACLELPCIADDAERGRICATQKYT